MIRLRSTSTFPVPVRHGRRFLHRAARLLVVALACGGGCSRRGEEPSWAERLLPRLSVRARVAQMVVAPVGGTRGAPLEQVLRWTRTDSIGGVRVDGGEARSMARLLAQVRTSAAVPLLVTAEVDGGVGALVPQATELPPARVLAALEDADLSREAGILAGREARALGIHLGVVSLPDAEPDPTLALPHPANGEITEHLAGMRSEGLLVGVRLLPPGGSPRDTAPVLRWDRARLEAVDFPAIRAAMERGVEAAALPALALPSLTGDSTPLALSRAAVAGVLRRDLGFGGLVLADVGAGSPLTRRLGEREAAVRAVAAGADLLLGVSDPPATIAAVVAAVRSGRIPVARVEQAARRILQAKERFATGSRKEVPADSVLRLLGTAEAGALARRAAERSLVVLGARPASLLRPCRVPLLVTRSGEAAVLQRELAALRPGLRTALLPPGVSPDSVLAGLASVIRSADCLVVAERESGVMELVRRAPRLDSAGGGATADTASRRPSAAPDRPTVLVRLLTAPPSVLPTAPSVVLVWGTGTEAQRAAARAVAGEVGADSRPPGSLRWPPARVLHAVEPSEVGMTEAA
ncbi:MAG TPA: glycoside hydrolase family 3 N-terminal domain-containing protein, partial [Longimicrobiaceae bacterium]|nr:glycoside hydrolase family 3 N-terminal domain-containing protein [Longimicrobiaceae bacterium]